ncbi:2,3-bisphosphoglycerate-independent phosphoglycerate mutase [Candidatus Babeliales bacterium]|nr:2,3-bisphosphoglycerate-independent phosphoglycerate mutase [Candidatus Babeliales bacterium]
MKLASSPVALIILDGFGFSKETKGNAIAQANMPFWKTALTKYPSTLLNASGEAVGLLSGLSGNSEVGHRTIGGGGITPTVLRKFHDILEKNKLSSHPILKKNFKKLEQSEQTLHLMGLLSDAGVHSHTDHLYGLLNVALKYNIKKIVVHTFLDGRDTPPKSAKQFLEQLEVFCKQHPTISIGSLHGRFFAMDRDKNWNRTEKTYRCLFKSNSIKNVSWQEALKTSYDNGKTDEFLDPVLLNQSVKIQNGDGIIFFNFRADRGKQLQEVFTNPTFKAFPRILWGKDFSFFITTNKFQESFGTNDITEHLFQHTKPYTSLLDEIADSGKKVFVIAETEKYAHVTYFFREATQNSPHKNIQTTLIPSIKVQGYAKNPEMSAQKITDAIVNSLHSDPADFYLVNFANPDMVGHSGDLQATIKACEFLDLQLQMLYKEIVEKMDGTIFITADHGNAEEMIDKQTGGPHTSHTANPVPFVNISNQPQTKTQSLEYIQPTLGLGNIAATILLFLDLKAPEKMEQQTIFKKS